MLLFGARPGTGRSAVVAAIVEAHQRYAPAVEFSTEAIDEATLAGEWPGTDLEG